MHTGLNVLTHRPRTLINHNFIILPVATSKTPSDSVELCCNSFESTFAICPHYLKHHVIQYVQQLAAPSIYKVVASVLVSWDQLDTL